MVIVVLGPRWAVGVRRPWPMADRQSPALGLQCPPHRVERRVDLQHVTRTGHYFGQRRWHVDGTAQHGFHNLAELRGVRRREEDADPIDTSRSCLPRLPCLP